jgi:hypothetical protein
MTVRATQSLSKLLLLSITYAQVCKVGSKAIIQQREGLILLILAKKRQDDAEYAPLRLES